MEMFSPDRNGFMLEEFGWTNGGGSPGQVQGRRKQKKRLSEVEVPFGMEEGTRKQEIQNMEVERRLLGKKFLPVQ